MLQDLGTVNTQEQLDYAKYLDQLTQYNTDRNFAYDTYLGDFNILQGQLASLQSQDDVDYGRLLDQINLGLQQDQTRYEREWNESERDYQRGQNEKSIAQAQVDAILAAGGTPSADLVGASGYTNEYVQALEAAYKREQAQSRSRSSSGSGGSSGGRSSGGGTGYNNAGLTTSQIQQMQTALGVTPDGMWGPETQAAAGGLSADQAWAIMSGGDGGGQDPGASVTNQTGDGWIRVAGYSRITWQELEAMVNRGEIIETYNPETGKYSYRKNPNYGK